MSGYVERQGQSSNIQWGRLAAGAAVATGVLLVGLSIGGGEVPILSDVAEGIKLMAASIYESVSTAISGLGSSAALPAPDAVAQGPGIFASLGEYLGNVGDFLTNNAKSLGGAALLATGLGYMAGHPASEHASMEAIPVPAASNTRMQTAQMGFAAREQMRVVNSLMQSRMQTFGQTDRQV